MLKKYYAYHLIGLLVMLRYSIRIISDILSPETISLMVLRLFLRLFSTIFFLSLFSSCSIIVAFHSTKDNMCMNLFLLYTGSSENQILLYHFH